MLSERARYLGRKTFGPVVRLGAVGALSVASISCSENKSPLQTDSSSPTNSQRKATDLEFPLTSGDWRLTNGPHPDVEPLPGYPKILSSLDFAPGEILSCEGDPQDKVKYEDDWVTSPVNGEVILVGDEGNIEDENHGLVEIKMENSNAQILLAHLTDLQVEVGDDLSVGDEIGHASCAHTPGVTNTGVHVHVGFRDNNIPQDISKARIVIAGEFEIKGRGVQNKDGFYDGTLENIRDGRKIIADGKVCGPDDTTARVNCGEKDGQLINNFIPSDALLNYEGESEDEETPQETQTEEVTDEYQDFRSETFNYESEIPENWEKREGAFLDGKAEFFENGDTYIAVSRQVNREPYDLEALEFRIQTSMELARPDDNYIIPESEDYEIDGEEAKYIKGTIENNGKRFNVSEVVFIKDGNYWIIAFLSPGSDHNEVFEHFLENFSTS